MKDTSKFNAIRKYDHSNWSDYLIQTGRNNPITEVIGDRSYVMVDATPEPKLSTSGFVKVFNGTDGVDFCNSKHLMAFYNLLCKLKDFNGISCQENNMGFIYKEKHNIVLTIQKVILFSDVYILTIYCDNIIRKFAFDSLHMDSINNIVEFIDDAIQ